MNASLYAHASRPATPHAAVAEARPARSFVQPAERTRTGRPTLQTPEIVECICAQIRTHGISDSAAGLLAGVSTSAVSRWKQEDETFATLLGQARAQYDVARLSAIRGACKRDGSPDWRAQAWLLQNSSPEEYGRPSRRSKYTGRAAQQEPTAQSPGVLTAADIEILQAARAGAKARPLAREGEDAGAEASATPERKVPKIPETPEPVEFMRADEGINARGCANQTPPSTGTVHAAETLPILPETPRPLTGPVAPAGLKRHVAAEREEGAEACHPSRNSPLHVAA